MCNWLSLRFRISCVVGLMLAWCSGLEGMAQPFSPMPAKDFPIGAEGMKAFEVRFSLGRNYKEYDYGVKVIYPEWEEVSKKEAKWLRLMKGIGEEYPRVHTVVKTSSKEGFLYASLLPIARRKGKYMRLVNCKLRLDSVRRTRSIKSDETIERGGGRYAEHSVLAKGNWYKISVKEEGVYELTAERLRKMGMKDLKRVKVYGYGGRLLPMRLYENGRSVVADDLVEVATMVDGDRRLLFFAEGTIRWNWDGRRKMWTHVNNTYSDRSYYFVTEGENPLRVKREEKAVIGEAKRVGWVMDRALRDKDAFAWFKGGTVFFDDTDLKDFPNYAYTLKLPGAMSGEKAKAEVAVGAASVVGATRVKVKGYDGLLGTLNVGKHTSSLEEAKECKGVYELGVKGDECKFSFTTTSGHSTRLDYICMTYKRGLRGDGFVFCPMTNGHGKQYLQWEDVGENDVLWRLGNGGSPTVEMPWEKVDNGYRVAVDREKDRYVVVNRAKAYEGVKWEGKVALQDLHAHGPVDATVIVPHSGMMNGAAARLKDLYEQRGMSVRVVDAECIYNEFSSGTPDPTAYRRYMKMLYDRAEMENRPKFLTLLGACYWDSRFMMSEKSRFLTPENLVLSYEHTENAGGNLVSIGSLKSYVTDDYFAFLDDEEGERLEDNLMDVAVGRLSAMSENNAKVLVDKVCNYWENKQVGTWKNRVVMLADEGDNYLHLEDSKAAAEEIEVVNPRMVMEKVYWGALPNSGSLGANVFQFASDVVKAKMKEGAVMFNYSGHGSPHGISHKKVLDLHDFEVKNNGNLPLWVFASCEVTPYDLPQNDIGRAAIFNEHGGAVAVVSASRVVYSVYNKELNKYFCKYLFENGNDKEYTMGEALQQAKRDVIFSGKDNTVNKLKYSLLGDPTLPLMFPRLRVKVDSIDGVEADGRTFQLKAGAKVKMAGHVEKHGKLMKKFMGEVTATLYDHEQRVVAEEEEEATSSYRMLGEKLFEGTDSVRNGKFEVELLIPKNIRYSKEHGALYLYAVNDAHGDEAAGKMDDFFMDGSEEMKEKDEEGPEVFVYLNSPDFPNNGRVGRNAVFGATVKDSAGINGIGAGVGHDVVLVMDGDRGNPICLNDFFKYDFGSTIKGRVIYPLENLTPGRHSLTFKIWDINDNSTTKRLDFVVEEGYNDEVGIVATDNPAYSSTSFITHADRMNIAQLVMVEVFDLWGRRIWCKDNVIPAGESYSVVRWNLNTSGGARVNKGMYIYRATVGNERGKQVTKAQKLIVQ